MYKVGYRTKRGKVEVLDIETTALPRFCVEQTVVYLNRINRHLNRWFFVHKEEGS